MSADETSTSTSEANSESLSSANTTIDSQNTNYSGGNGSSGNNSDENTGYEKLPQTNEAKNGIITAEVGAGLLGMLPLAKRRKKDSKKQEN